MLCFLLIEAGTGVYQNVALRVGAYINSSLLRSRCHSRSDSLAMGSTDNRPAVSRESCYSAHSGHVTKTCVRDSGRCVLSDLAARKNPASLVTSEVERF
jgi:hypothetical protein